MMILRPASSGIDHPVIPGVNDDDGVVFKMIIACGDRLIVVWHPDLIWVVSPVTSTASVIPSSVSIPSLVAISTSHSGENFPGPARSERKLFQLGSSIRYLSPKSEQGTTCEHTTVQLIHESLPTNRRLVNVCIEEHLM